MYCSFCNNYGHTSKTCKIEKDLSYKLNELVGGIMEYYTSNNIKCPECNCSTLHVLDNNTPSCDIICNHCNKMFEIKSKCLSCPILPNDIFINHGHFEKFISRINQGLNIIVIIYSVNNYNKSITIREALYINNSNIRNQKIINISKKKESNNTSIVIKNRKLLSKLITHNYTTISLEHEINDLMSE
jgi:hypothetical protein